MFNSYVQLCWVARGYATGPPCTSWGKQWFPLGFLSVTPVNDVLWWPNWDESKHLVGTGQIGHIGLILERPVTAVTPLQVSCAVMRIRILVKTKTGISEPNTTPLHVQTTSQPISCGIRCSRTILNKYEVISGLSHHGRPHIPSIFCYTSRFGKEINSKT